jgi:hypothetical protein
MRFFVGHEVSKRAWGFFKCIILLATNDFASLVQRFLIAWGRPSISLALVTERVVLRLLRYAARYILKMPASNGCIACIVCDGYKAS